MVDGLRLSHGILGLNVGALFVEFITIRSET